MYDWIKIITRQVMWIVKIEKNIYTGRTINENTKLLNYRFQCKINVLLNCLLSLYLKLHSLFIN